MDDLNINLDCFTMDPKELYEVGRVFQKLANYATTKSCAMKDRLAGNIKAALESERKCEAIYRTLPSWARW